VSSEEVRHALARALGWVEHAFSEALPAWRAWREEALKATHEAVELRRALSLRNPDVFQPDLAGGLNNLGLMLRELGRREEALACFEEALNMIWPFFMSRSHAFMRNTGLMIRNLLQTYDALQRSPPPALVERVEEFTRLASLSRPPG
jgi:tetratricopeptide (TPR) repeat protein